MRQQGGFAPIHYVRMFTDGAGNPPSHKQLCLVLDGLKKYVSGDPQHDKFCADVDNARLYTNLSWPRPFFIYISQSGNPAESPSPAAPRPGAGQPRLVDGFVRRDAPLPLRDNRVRWNNVKMNAANSYRRGSSQPRVPPGRRTCQRRATTRTDGRPHCRPRELAYKDNKLLATGLRIPSGYGHPYIRPLPASKNSRRSRQGKTAASTKMLHGLT
jgi:hypothetical protein